MLPLVTLYIHTYIYVYMNGIPNFFLRSKFMKCMARNTLSINTVGSQQFPMYTSHTLLSLNCVCVSCGLHSGKSELSCGAAITYAVLAKDMSVFDYA